MCHRYRIVVGGRHDSHFSQESPCLRIKITRNCIRGIRIIEKLWDAISHAAWPVSRRCNLYKVRSGWLALQLEAESRLTATHPSEPNSRQQEHTTIALGKPGKFSPASYLQFGAYCTLATRNTPTFQGGRINGRVRGPLYAAKFHFAPARRLLHCPVA